MVSVCAPISIGTSIFVRTSTGSSTPIARRRAEAR